MVCVHVSFLQQLLNRLDGVLRIGYFNGRDGTRSEIHSGILVSALGRIGGCSAV